MGLEAYQQGMSEEELIAMVVENFGENAVADALSGYEKGKEMR